VGVAPWFKFFAGDYLIDPDVDALPLEAQAVLIRMWCVVWIEGELPIDPVQIARKCRVDVLHVHMHLQKLMQFFSKTEFGGLVSLRMEKERSKSGQLSAVRSKAAKLKHLKSVAAHAGAKDDAQDGAKRPAKKLHSDIRSQISEKTKKPSCADAQASMGDDRWADFIEDWKVAFEYVTGKKFNPSPADFATLKAFLAENRDVKRDVWRKCLNNWAKSPISHTKPFRYWGKRALEFEQGPLDKYWEPVNARSNANSNGASKAERRIFDMVETTSRVFDPTGNVPDDAPGGIPDEPA